jgi:uncharacterized protein (DUF433 family)
MEIAPRISVDDKVHFGKPVVTGTRVPVDLVLAQLAGGMTYEEVVEQYGISVDDIKAVLSYAAETLGEVGVTAVP